MAKNPAKNPDDREKVAKHAMTIAGASSGGIAIIIGAAASGTVPVGLIYLAISVFGLIFVVAFIVMGIYFSN